VLRFPLKKQSKAIDFYRCNLTRMVKAMDIQSILKYHNLMILTAK
jgi:hypothetical protein